jgi:hypothetical protein
MQLNHQGRLVDSSGLGLDCTGHTPTFAVTNAATGDSAVWTAVVVGDVLGHAQSPCLRGCDR